MWFLKSRKNLFLILILYCVACKKEKDNLIEIPPTAENGKNVLVLNEGNYTWGNASLSHINLKTGLITGDVFQPSNNRPLGDVLQSAFFVSGKIWLIVNNSGKIERIDPVTFQAINSVQGLQSPRYACEIGEDVFISDLYSGKIRVIDKNSGLITGSISCPGWTEQLLNIGDELWVCNVSANKVYVADSKNRKLIDSLWVGDAPTDIARDREGMLWILCQGSLPPSETSGSLWRINPISRKILNKYSLKSVSGTSHPTRLCINKSGDWLFFLNHGIYKMRITDSEIPSEPFISEGKRVLYGLAVNPFDETIWVSDAIDYIQKGRIYCYSNSGQELRSWQGGMIPSGFVFY